MWGWKETRWLRKLNQVTHICLSVSLWSGLFHPTHTHPYNRQHTRLIQLWVEAMTLRSHDTCCCWWIFFLVKNLFQRNPICFFCCDSAYVMEQWISKLHLNPICWFKQRTYGIDERTLLVHLIHTDKQLNKLTYNVTNIIWSEMIIYQRVDVMS